MKILIYKILVIFILLFLLIYISHIISYIDFCLRKDCPGNESIIRYIEYLLFYFKPKSIIGNYYFSYRIFIPSTICLFLYLIIKEYFNIVKARVKLIIYGTLVLSLYLILASYNYVLDLNYKKVVFTFLQNYGDPIDHSRRFFIHIF